jgi:hypothetical protein
VGDDKTIRRSHYVALIVIVPRGCRLVSMHVTLVAHEELFHLLLQSLD